MYNVNMQSIGVFFGSRTPEHDVSIITAQLIIAGLKKNGYSVVPVYITKKGIWCVGEELGSFSFFTKSPSESDLKKFSGWNLSLNLDHKITLHQKNGIFSKKYVIDVAFPAVHGEFGEDGTLQGLFEMLGIPYVGCNVPSSAVCMDKVLTKQLYSALGIPTTRFQYFDRAGWLADQSGITALLVNKLKFPMFVKPARLGSSIGISKVANKEELVFGIEVALHYEEKILVEEGVAPVRDLTVAVMGLHELKSSLIQESLFNSKFNSYEDKYIEDGGSQTGKAAQKMQIPALLDAPLTEKIRSLAVLIYKYFECSGIARVDFLYNENTGEYFANEINTLPGTLYHHLWAKSGVSIDELLTKLVEYALERHGTRQKIIRVFDSDIFKNINSNKLSSKLGGGTPS